jgi:hypothetical protein
MQFRSILVENLPGATSFLADRITALEGYYGTHILRNAITLLEAGDLKVKRIVIAAIQHRKEELSRVMGNVGEQVAAQVLSEKFGVQEISFDRSKHGFDHIYRIPGIPLVVMESKASFSGKLQQSQDSGSIANLVQELGLKNLPAMSIVVNPATGSSDIYTRLQTGGWQLL